MRRIYCGRVGAVFELEAGKRCPECYSNSHIEYKQDSCGCYAQPGTHCVLPTGHPGDHIGELLEDSELEEIIETVSSDLHDLQKHLTALI